MIATQIVQNGVKVENVQKIRFGCPKIVVKVVINVNQVELKYVVAIRKVKIFIIITKNK